MSDTDIKQMADLVNRIGYDESSHEWEYDGAYVTREEVTNRLVYDFTCLARDTDINQIIKTIKGWKDEEELQTPELRQYGNQGSDPFYCTLCGMSEMKIMDNKKDDKYFCACSWWDTPHNAFLDRSGGNWLGWLKGEEHARKLMGEYNPNIHNITLDKVITYLESLKK